MKMGGIVGSLEYKGGLTSFLPLVSIGKRLHIGRQTDFGLAQYDFEVL